ncbi:MAG: hypothetical protein WED11_11795, partial [Natronospirillum sp.]
QSGNKREFPMKSGLFPTSPSSSRAVATGTWGRLALCVLAFSLSLTARAQTSGTDTIGTLFTTPYEREYMDRLRNEYLLEQARDSFDIEEQAPPPMIEESEEVVEESPTLRFHLGGIMQRNDGTRILWLNGTQVTESDLPRDVSLVQDNDNHALRIRTQQQSHLLRVGQIINLETGLLQEAYEVTPQPVQSDNPEMGSPVQVSPPSPSVPPATGQDAETIIAQLIEALQQLQETQDEE